MLVTWSHHSLRIFGLSIAALICLSPAQANDVSVSGYFRSNGAYVQPYFRSAPDGSVYNNFSTVGNTNPYTGQEGTKNPSLAQSDSYLPSNPYADESSTSLPAANSISLPSRNGISEMPLPKVASKGNEPATASISEITTTGLTWNDSRCNFSLVNRLDRPVSEVRFVLNVYDKSGDPIDSVEGSFPYNTDGPQSQPASIQPGSARRMQCSVGSSSANLIQRTDIKILSYRFADPARDSTIGHGTFRSF